MKIFDICGYTGSLLMVIFSFCLIPQIAICGLLCLTVQSIESKIHNLTILNIISIIGFSYNFFF